MAGSVQITARRYPELHRAGVALLGPRKAFKVPEHFETWLPKADRGLKALRRRDEDDWRTFVVGGADLSDVLRVRDRYDDIRGAHQILDYLASE